MSDDIFRIFNQIVILCSKFCVMLSLFYWYKSSDIWHFRHWNWLLKRRWLLHPYLCHLVARFWGVWRSWQVEYCYQV